MTDSQPQRPVHTMVPGAANLINDLVNALTCQRITHWALTTAHVADTLTMRLDITASTGSA